MDIKTLETLILRAIPGASVQIDDLRGDGQPHYSVHVISASFDGKPLVQQHREVYAAVKSCFNPDLHAITLRTSAA